METVGGCTKKTADVRRMWSPVCLDFTTSEGITFPDGAPVKNIDMNNEIFIRECENTGCKYHKKPVTK